MLNIPIPFFLFLRSCQCHCFHFPLLLLTLALLCPFKGIAGDEVRISNPSEFSSFASNVSNGVTYLGTTVYLDSDLSLSEVTEPIGKGTSNYFRGIFDGQGYIISNLKITSSSLAYMGLFGYSKGLAIRNTVLDSSCSMSNAYIGSVKVYLGGLIGQCDGQCNIENSVNMADVTFSGYINGYTLYIAGFAGYIYFSSSVYLKNCANYGSITHSGTSSSSYIGGIVGYFYGSSSDYGYAYNCLNYGAVVHTGTSSPYTGGIIGYASSYINVGNCMSAGKITSTLGTRGSVVGYVNCNTYGCGELECVEYYSGDCYNWEWDYADCDKYNCDEYDYGVCRVYISTIDYCFFTSDTVVNNLYGSGIPKSTTGSSTSSVSASSAASSLNNRVSSSNGWNKWLLNENNATITFKINNETLSFSSSLIIIPSPVSGWRNFIGWFTNSSLTTSFTGSSISSSTTLYGKWDKYIITFDPNGGSVSETSKIVEYNSTYGDLPTPKKTGGSFDGWFTEKTGGTKISSSATFTDPFNNTLYAHWTIVRYTISFVSNGGSECDNITQEYNTLLTLPDPQRTGYTFTYWCSDADLNTKYTAQKIEAKNVTLYARWTANSYTVSFDAECGVSENPVVVIYDGAYSLPEPTRPGCNLLWWDVEGTAVNVSNGTTVSVAENHTLCAVWDTNPVTLNATGGNVTIASLNATYNKGYSSLPVATRTGYTFVGWSTSEAEDGSGGDDSNVITDGTTVVTPYPHTLYACWAINSYTATFDFMNGTTIEVIFKYGENITYPEVQEREGYTFAWNTTFERMPAYNLAVAAQWTSLLNKNESFSPLVIGLIVAIFIIIVIAISVIAVLFVLLKKKVDNITYERKYELDRPLMDQPLTPDDASDNNSTDGNYRVVAASNDEVESEAVTKNPASLMNHLYPKGYKRPSMREALLKAKLTGEQVDLICSACEGVGNYSMDEGKLFMGFTEEDAAAIAMYTYDFGAKEFESNPYRIINRSLVGRNYANLQKASGLLYIVMTALRKLPRITGITLYRGVRGEVNLDKDHYYSGNIIAWPALSSTSPSMDETKKFLAKGSKSGKTKGSLFIIEDGWGYDIQPYSLFPGEAEILLEPERQFKVTGVIEAEGLTFINLQMLDTPLSIPKVFGGNDW